MKSRATARFKAELVENLALGFEQCRVKIPNDVNLIAELQAFEATQLPSGMMRYAAPARECMTTWLCRSCWPIPACSPKSPAPKPGAAGINRQTPARQIHGQDHRQSPRAAKRDWSALPTYEA